MNRITVPDPLKAQFDRMTSPVELVDEAGRRLGHFVPTSAAVSPDECPYSPEELEQMRNEQGGRSLQEIWRALGERE